MQSLFSLIPLWLAATVVGLPLQSSPGDTWRSEVDHGISGSRRHREVMPWLHLHDHPRATVVEVVLGESQSRLRKRGIIQDVRGKVHEWYRKTRNDMWSSRDEQRCLIRKVDLSQRPWQPIICMIAETVIKTSGASSTGSINLRRGIPVFILTGTSPPRILKQDGGRYAAHGRMPTLTRRTHSSAKQSVTSGSAC